MFLSQVCSCFYLTFSQKEYILTVCKKVVKSRLNNWPSTVRNYPCIKALKFSNSNAFSALTNEPTRALLLDTSRPYSTLNVSCIDNCIYCTLKHFFRIALVSHSIVYNFSQKCRQNWEIRADWKNKSMSSLRAS